MSFKGNLFYVSWTPPESAAERISCFFGRASYKLPLVDRHLSSFTKLRQAFFGTWHKYIERAIGAVMVVCQKRAAFSFDFLGQFAPANGFTVKTSPSYQIAFVFTADHTAVIQSLRFYIAAIAGSLGSNDLSCSLVSSTGTTLETHTLGIPPVVGWNAFTTFTTQLSGGHQYAFVITNLNGSAGTNYPTIYYTEWCKTDTMGGILPTSTSFGGNPLTPFQNPGYYVATTTTGVSGFSVAAVASGVRLGYADGSYDGLPIYNYALGQVYGTILRGVKFTSPSVPMNVAGVTLFTAPAIGGPSGTYTYQLYNDTTLLATSYSLPYSGISNSNNMPGYFSSTIRILPNTTVRFVLADSAGNTDDISNCWQTNEYMFDSDSCVGGTVNLMPFDGTAQLTYYDGSTWHDVPTSLMGFGLLLDSSGEFNPTCPVLGSSVISSNHAYN